MNSRAIVVLAVIVVAIVGAAMWFLQSQPPPKTLPAPLALATPAPGPIPTLPTPPRTDIPQPRPSATPAPVSAVGQPQPRQMEDWEVKIDQVLKANPDNSDAANTATAQMLINLLPTLPPDGQAEAAQHISNLILDKDYSRLMPLIRNPSLPEEVHDVFVTDLMNREDAVKLPALLEIAKIPNHPYHEEAQTDLQIFVDEDYGTDWEKWDKAVKDYLRKQALEEAGANAPTTPQSTPEAALTK